MKFTDSHFHSAHLAERGIDLSSISLRAGLDIGTEENDISYRLPIVNKLKNIKYTIGAGPWCANKDIKAVLKQIYYDVKNNKASAIGEIGLDYFHHDYGSKENQIELFESQLNMANEFSLPICVHTRDSFSDTITTLKSTMVNKRGVIHCFSGDKNICKEFLDLGYYISFACNITYKKNDTLRQALSYVPLDRLLLETDAPYLSPLKLRSKANSPMYIEAAYVLASEIKNTSLEEINNAVYKNFISLF